MALSFIGLIEPSIPIPNKSPVFRKESRNYPFAAMQPGDSFFSNLPREILSAATWDYGRRYKVKFTIRNWIEKGKRGRRVWRAE